MSTELEQLLNELKPRQDVNSDDLVRLRRKGLPEDYLSFMQKQNGGFGRIGEKRNYIDLWAALDVLDLNPYYQGDFAERVMCIGSGGGGKLYGYDVKGGNFLHADEFAFSDAEAHVCGPGFLDLIRHVANGEG